MFKIHQSIKNDFVQELKNQTLSMGKLFSISLIIVCGLLIVLDTVLGWSHMLLFYRLVPIISAIAYLSYDRYLKLKLPNVFSLIYAFMIISIMVSVSGVCFEVFSHTGVQNIDKLGVTVGMAAAIFVCYLCAGIAVLSLLWLIGVPLLLTVLLINLNTSLTVVDWMALAIPLLVFATIGFLCGEQFFLKTKYFAIQRRSQNQSSLIEELKLSHKSLMDQNIFLTEQLKSNSTFDQLTSAFSLSAGLELLEKEFYYSQRNNEPLTVAYVKVENVDWINREYGKEFADKTVAIVAETIKETIRKSDLLIRIEEDQFVVVFRQCETRSANKVIERAQSRAARISSQSSFEINFRAGFAESSNDEFSTSRQMLEFAAAELKKGIDTSTSATSTSATSKHLELDQPALEQRIT